MLLGNKFLSAFNGFVVEFNNGAAAQTHQMVVVPALIQFKGGFTRFKIGGGQQAYLGELGQHAVNRGQTQVAIFGQGFLKYIFSAQMALFALLKNLQHCQARGGDF